MFCFLGLGKKKKTTVVLHRVLERAIFTILVLYKQCFLLCCRASCITFKALVMTQWKTKEGQMQPC